MRQGSYLVITLAAAFLFTGQPVWVGQTIIQVEAQTTKKKTTTKKTAKKKPAQKKSYCGYPAPPIPAGMSDFCAREYDLFCRRGVGCNQYGR